VHAVIVAELASIVRTLKLRVAHGVRRKGRIFGCQTAGRGELPFAINSNFNVLAQHKWHPIGFFVCLSKLGHIPSPSTR
jgi:hypothetical protein